MISFHMIIERFLDHLPSSVPYDILRFHTMKTINDISDDDITAFIKLTDEVLAIDNTYHCTSNNRPTTTRSLNNVPHIPHASITQPLSSVIATKPRCSNCGILGHLIDKCFKAGGGLEGKCDQYLTSRNRVQAHLALLTELLDSNSVEETNQPTAPLEPQKPDIIDEPEIPPPSLTALSLTLADVSSPVVIDTEVNNDDFYFGYYTQSEHKKLIAFTSFPPVLA